MNEPLFSVLIANYNNGRYLQEAIDSVLAQTYTHWEIVLVDDKSTDNSSEICDKYKDDSRFRIYHNDENRGCGYTKRRCAELAHGEVCGFLDSDDRLAPEAVATMVEAHATYNKCSLIYSQYYLCDAESQVLGVSSHQCRIPEEYSFLTCPNTGAVSHFATFKKSFYDKTEGIDPHMLRAVDVDTYLKLEEVGELRFIPVPLYHYRTNTGNNVSLGDENSRKALYWSLFARTKACLRRNMSIEDTLFPFIDAFMESERKESFLQGEDSVRMTKAYRWGSALRKVMVPKKKN